MTLSEPSTPSSWVLEMSLLLYCFLFLSLCLGIDFPYIEEAHQSGVHHHHLWYPLDSFLLGQSLRYCPSCCILLLLFLICRFTFPPSFLIRLLWVWLCACPSLSLSAVTRLIRAPFRHLLLLLAHCCRATSLALEFLVVASVHSLLPPPTLLFRTLAGMISFPCSFLLVFINIFPSIWLPSSLPVVLSLVSFSSLSSRRYILHFCV